MDDNIYTSGEYLQNNPTLDVEDTPWKLTKLFPIVDAFIKESSLTKVTILDVGGGAGLILKGIVDYMKGKEITVKQYALDLSDEMLTIQKKNNPEINRVVNGDISETSFENKSIDLVLMVDVLEHIPDAVKTLKELKRISKYVIFKVPLEDNLFFNILNFIKRGGVRRDIIDKVGHINSYNFKKLKEKINENTGSILCYSFTNVFAYYMSEKFHKPLLKREKVLYTLGKLAFFLSPRLSSYIFPDFVAGLVKCR